ncbi:export protein [Salmonella enterica subsp. enterica]|uniref:Export protein n=1 Tax=Salmonella enterica I TaxID=59201 RepID=A0A379WT71_SALET|nr:export protein [Salmonella enterica subsp. enterica]
MNALTFGLLITALSGFAQGQSLTLIGAELLVLVVVGFFFVRRQLSLPVPLLPIDLLRIPLFSLSISTSICSFCAQMLAMVSLPFYLQTVLGRSEVETGLLLTPWPLATMVMAPLAGYLIERLHAGLLGALGMVIMAARVVCAGHVARLPLRSEYYLADDPLRRRVWPVPVAE